jgi:hypothetical protein
MITAGRGGRDREQDDQAHHDREQGHDGDPFPPGQRARVPAWSFPAHDFFPRTQARRAKFSGAAISPGGILCG